MTRSKDRVRPRSGEDRSSEKKSGSAGPPERAGKGAAAGTGAAPAPEGGRDAFEEVFRQYRERVYRVAYGWCFNTQTALDLVQDVFVKAFRSFDTFRQEASIWTWLCRITINRCLDYVRKKGRAKEVLVEAPQDIVPYGRKAYPEPSEEAELAELKGALTGAIGRLSPEARSAFVLRFFDNLSYREIAQALDCSVGTVMSRLFYARQKLRTLLEGYL